nr:MAG TPA: hemolysin [Caudoviricetes sp.]
MDEKKFVAREVFQAREDTLNAKIDVLKDKIEQVSEQLDTIMSLNEKIVAHDKDIESVRRDGDQTKERLRRLEENQSKIVWAVGLAVLGGIVQFVLNGGLHK